jgi:protocatechuate 3,4-dioxygenase, beta subunit
MKRNNTVVALALLLGAMSAVCIAQVDPFWMRSWNEAQKSRPPELHATARIAPESEPGTPLIIHGVVVEPDGRTPARGVVVHAYHRDQKGFDFGANDSASSTWRLQGWAKTDDAGRFEFKTIRPAPDNMDREGAHVHFTLEAGTRGRQWAHMVFLADDRRVTARQREQSAAAGEFAWVKQPRIINGVQSMDVRIRLKEEADF